MGDILREIEEIRRTTILGPFATLIAAALTAASETTVAPQSPPPTYWSHIAPIVAHYCAPCHGPEGAAPFSLTTFADVRGAERNCGLASTASIAARTPASNPRSVRPSS